MKWHWRSIASLALGLGALGVVLPGLPTTPFLLLAAWAGARGWPHMEQRLLRHPKYGPVIIDWRERRAVPRTAKWMASAMQFSSLVSIWLLAAPVLLPWFLTRFRPCVALGLWSRPDSWIRTASAWKAARRRREFAAARPG